MHDLSPVPESGALLAELKSRLLGELWGSDLEKWVENGELVGEPDRTFVSNPNRTLLGQRGWR
jgi:hypothetical protein